MNPSVDRDAVKRQVEDLKATIKKRNEGAANVLANEARIKRLQEMLRFKFNPNINYSVSPNKIFIRIDVDSLIIQDIHVTTNEGNSFRASFTNIFERYKRPPITDESGMISWKNSPMQYWQNQLCCMD